MRTAARRTPGSGILAPPFPIMFSFLQSDDITIASVVIFTIGGLVCAFFALREELRRRKMVVSPFVLVVAASLAGLIGAQLFGSFGFGYIGAFIAGIAVLALLAGYYRAPTLTLLDATCSAAAIGYGVFRVGDLFRSNREYVAAARALRLELRPVHELVAAVIIFWILWRLGTISLHKPVPQGEVFSIYLICFGGARLLISYFNSVPRVLRLNSAMIASSVCVLAGVVLYTVVKLRFHKIDKHHRILEHADRLGDVIQPESKAPTPECPHPERWRMYDSMTAEVEVLEFLKSLVTTIKPALVVETGTFMGVSTLRIAEGLKENGFGRVITCESDPTNFAVAKKRFQASDLSEWIDCRNASSLEIEVKGTIDLLFCDSDLALRELEVRRFLPQMNPNGIILMHDASSYLKTVRQAALRLEAEGLISVVLLPTPRGLVVAQKREGRA
ncbi:MAG TPA: prolipoprotein diacylglyceryl transferase family protein [Candidatus Limnocylindrales bacterium]|nr:prolipoprotein diacylglyceryl transferase family protein [Candidatus Limnocylindrales bacterium]